MRSRTLALVTAVLFVVAAPCAANEEWVEVAKRKLRFFGKRPVKTTLFIPARAAGFLEFKETPSSGPAASLGRQGSES